jgi:predicted Rossmann-fold nucleotide-binding protein
LPKIWRPVTFTSSTEKFAIRLELEEDSTTDFVDLPGDFVTLEEALDEIENLKKAKVNKKPARR